MSAQTDPERTEVLASITQAWLDLTEGSGEPCFVNRYYRHVPTDELLARPVQVLAGMAQAHHELAEQRPVGVAKVRIFNPVSDSEGWGNTRTVVQIVTDDMPFLVDSVTAAIVDERIDVHLIVHPQLVVRRNAVGDLEEVVDRRVKPGRADAVGEVSESWMMLTIDRQGDEARRDEIERRVHAVLDDVREIVEDWPKMRSKCLVLAAELEGGAPSTVPPDEVARTIAFLRWMADDNFTFLGFRSYDLGERGEDTILVPRTGSGLGLLRSDPYLREERRPLTGRALELAREKHLLIVTKANSRSTVHRNAYLDYVGIKAFDAKGEVIGENRFLGLYASTAYTDSVMRVPYLAEKVTAIVEAADFPEKSHTAKDLLGVLENHPRDELFQATSDELLQTALAVTALQERRRTKLFLRYDPYGRFVSCLVYLPRDRYNTVVRTRMSEILVDSFHAESAEFTARVSESALARLLYVIHMPRGKWITPLTAQEQGALEARLVEVSRTWTDRLFDALVDKRGELDAEHLMGRFGGGFPAAYEEEFTVSQGVADLSHLDRLGPDKRTSVALYRPADAPDTVRRFKLFRLDPLSLTDILPIFTDMGVEVVDEQPFEITRTDGQELSVYDFGLRAPTAAVWDAVSHEELRDLFESAVLAVWTGQAESDGFNKLILAAQLTWRQVTILRALAKYLRQTRPTFSHGYFEDALVTYPQVARYLVELFETRFNPALFKGKATKDREEAEQRLVAAITESLESVGSLDHDRIIRAFLGVIRATLRTNYYQVGSDGKPTATLACKLDPKQIPDLPAPRPAYEIWVYSPRVEGVHLRFGAVARGGLRWSDRREDFRTEILGLVKAQMVKNAVIVPTGSKGGFYPKQLPDPLVDRDAWLTEGKAAYRTFISGLLDLTDNRVGTKVVPPKRVVRHDGDDPYLVVAADKGTATFSDLANSVAAEYGFWLDDAFASGGSAGYDHKEMGITARGAWEAVKAHFRELDVDTQTEDFTVVGIGDMSGDVFGNGMLLSEHIRLLAAFDHRHIFVDPDPDPAVSYAERRRLFELPRSSWEDYDPTLISKGGGVFPRTLKAIKITAAMREALGLAENVMSLTPAELMRAVLLSPVDLLWNGGIGTYVKAKEEENADVGDRANDSIRVDGSQLRVKVVGEGGNLGLTQLGRIEAARNGVRLNTDAVDNSAGVDTSDHEVNIKILLGGIVARGDLTLKDRNALLASMTEEVGEQVLEDNYEQNVLLANARVQQHSMAGVHQRFIRALERRGLLDRALEFLPSDAELEKRAHEGSGLTSPELSVLLAYAKIALKEDLLASALPDDPVMDSVLAGYFPQALRERYAEEFAAHPLRREIVATVLSNAVINRGGITFVHRAAEETGASVEQVVRAFVICREVFDLTAFTDQVVALDNQVPVRAQIQLYLEFRRLLDRSVRWFLRSRTGTLDIAAEIDRFDDVVGDLHALVPEMLRGGERERLERRVAQWTAVGVPESLATEGAALLDWYSMLDVADIASDTGSAPDDVAALYYALSAKFDIDFMLTQVTALPREDHWDSLARGALRDDLYSLLETMARSAIALAAPKRRGKGLATFDGPDVFERWVAEHAAAIERAQGTLGSIHRLDRAGVTALSVALRTLRGIL